MNLETITVGAILAIFTGMLGALLGSKNKVTTDEFEKHKDDSSPHKACPVHAEKFNTIENKLTSIEGKIDKLMER